MFERISKFIQSARHSRQQSGASRFWKVSPAEYVWHYAGAEPVYFHIEFSAIKQDSFGDFSVKMNIDRAGIRVDSVGTLAGEQTSISLGNDFFIPRQLKRRGLATAQVAKSPMWMHREMHQRARQFKQDFQFDFRQWEGSEKTKNMCPESHGYLFNDHTIQYGQGAAVGACAFWGEAGKWRMRWIWVCPTMRRSGVLTRRWHQFLDRYGDFKIEAPLSDAMAAFVAKHGTQAQKDQLQL